MNDVKANSKKSCKTPLTKRLFLYLMVGYNIVSIWLFGFPGMIVCYNYLYLIIDFVQQKIPSLFSKYDPAIVILPSTIG